MLLKKKDKKAKKVVEKKQVKAKAAKEIPNKSTTSEPSEVTEESKTTEPAEKPTAEAPEAEEETSIPKVAEQTSTSPVKDTTSGGFFTKLGQLVNMSKSRLEAFSNQQIIFVLGQVSRFFWEMYSTNQNKYHSLSSFEFLDKL